MSRCGGDGAYFYKTADAGNHTECNVGDFVRIRHGAEDALESTAPCIWHANVLWLRIAQLRERPHARLRCYKKSVSTPVYPYSRLCEISPLQKKPTSGTSRSAVPIIFSSSEFGPKRLGPRPRHE
ncbi:MAG: hypothetical protein JWN13_2769 [Betaproteobacteria bacterium]|jgi:hypothetical protein|nr:hypothetical protein [Betaproteobacteria bacterium]